MPAIWWLLAGCGWFGGGEAPEVTDAPEAAAEAPDEGPAAPAGAPDVFFFVLDTVRADHTSLCGYDRPTTPTLEALNTAGASVSCQVRAPADWTIPSHASLFTGKTVLEHGAVIAKNSDVALNAYTSVRPLPADLPTLAEHFKGLGYVTVAISANPIVREEAGLMRGFDVHVSGPPRKLAGPGLAAELRTQLRGIDRDKPLFLFVNIFDAHDPYPAVPADAGWAPERARVDFAPKKKKPNNPYDRFLAGQMTPEEREAWLHHVTDAYDWAVHAADENLGGVLEALERSGFANNGHRTVITSDHGEFLGEHDQLRHGGFVYEPVVKVPFVWVDSAARPAPITEPFSAMNVFAILGGARLEAPFPAHAVSTKNPQNQKVGVDAVAAWLSPTEKHLWWSGERRRVDLKVDPGELNPSPLEAPSPALDGVVQAFEAHLAKKGGENPELVQQLQEIGYLEE
jgi:arylsulfatase A-like enzyme